MNYKKLFEGLGALAGVAVSLSGIKGLWDSLKGQIDENAIYTVKQVAKFLKVRVEKVVELIESGQLRARKLGPDLKDYRVTGKSVLDFLNCSRKCYAPYSVRIIRPSVRIIRSARETEGPSKLPSPSA